jgi:hypothetical protein
MGEQKNASQRNRLWERGLETFLCGLFNDAISSLDYIASNDRTINE